MTPTKDRIIDRMHKNTNLKKVESVRTSESLLEIMKQTLSSGENILISGYEKFCIKEKRERRGKNPQAGNDLTLGARRVVTFAISVFVHCHRKTIEECARISPGGI